MIIAKEGFRSSEKRELNECKSESSNTKIWFGYKEYEVPKLISL